MSEVITNAFDLTVSDALAGLVPVLAAVAGSALLGWVLFRMATKITNRGVGK